MLTITDLEDAAAWIADTYHMGVSDARALIGSALFTPALDDDDPTPCVQIHALSAPIH